MKIETIIPTFLEIECPFCGFDCKWFGSMIYTRMMQDNTLPPFMTQTFEAKRVDRVCGDLATLFKVEE